jgi:Caspase domain
LKYQLICAAALCAAGMFATLQAHAETHALLIGVSGYPSLAQNKRLRGPANDVQIMRASLLQSGIASSAITTLADGVTDQTAKPAQTNPQSSLPTKQNIISGLRGLAQRARPGDWVIVYFSGHGSQQPQPPASKLSLGTYIEPDGLDEIFLPYDVSRWNGAKGAVDGALIDDEIGHEFDKITKRGIKLWAIFDTCHSGGMAKSINLSDNAPVNRYVTPESLGVPTEALAEAYSASQSANAASSGNNSSRSTATYTSKGFNTRSVSTVPNTARVKSKFEVKTGELVVFYASQPEEPAAEEPLPTPPGLKLSGQQPANGKPYFGLFTYLIAQALPTWRGNFKQLADTVAQQYKSRPYPNPLFEGNLDKTPYLTNPALTSR